MNSVQIKFAPDILRRLGEELNPSPDKGILELVKNAYDADARNCTVELSRTEQPGGSISITDDGDGMDEDVIKKGWLIIGRSEKSSKQTTKLGRIPVGSKGLGRLAALRMGSKAILTTRPRDKENSQYSLLIDWDQYEHVELIDEVDLIIEDRNRPTNSKPGTEMVIVNLRS